MQALQLKRHGHNVTVLEQDTASDRDSHEAGVAFEANMDEFLKRYDATGLAMSLPSEIVRVAYGRRWPHVRDLKIQRRLSSWGFLYRILRANLDGFASEACRRPPAKREGDGEARYLSGKRVEGLKCQGETVTVLFVDVGSGKEEAIDADLVIGADGVHSTFRQVVAAPMVADKSYAGYVAWRGTVKESLLSKETVEYFADKVVFQVMRRTYMVVSVTRRCESGTLQLTLLPAT